MRVIKFNCILPNNFKEKKTKQDKILIINDIYTQQYKQKNIKKKEKRKNINNY